jgi:hypothetical protein
MDNVFYRGGCVRDVMHITKKLFVSLKKLETRGYSPEFGRAVVEGACRKCFPQRHKRLSAQPPRVEWRRGMVKNERLNLLRARAIDAARWSPWRPCSSAAACRSFAGRALAKGHDVPDG